MDTNNLDVSSASVDETGQVADAMSRTVFRLKDDISYINDSATAKESAAASEELSGQSQRLKTLVRKFKLLKSDHN